MSYKFNVQEKKYGTIRQQFYELPDRGLCNFYNGDSKLFFKTLSGKKLNKNQYLVFQSEAFDSKNIDLFQNKYLSYIPKCDALINNKSIKENLELAFLVSQLEYRLDSIKELFSLVDLAYSDDYLDVFLDLKVKRLTRLDYFKLSLAISLLKKPKIIIIESMNNLLNDDMIDCLNIIKKLSRDRAIYVSCKNDSKTKLYFDFVVDLKELKPIKIAENSEFYYHYDYGDLSHKNSDSSVIKQSLKHNKASICSMIALTSVIFGLFTTSISLYSTDSRALFIDKLYENDVDSLMIEKKYMRADGHSGSYDIIDYDFDEEEKQRITEHNNNSSLFIDVLPSSFSIQNNVIEKIDTFSNLYFQEIYGLEITDKTTADCLNLKPVNFESRFPKNKDEIALTDYQANLLCNYGLSETTSHLTPTELIGKKYNGLTITGIFKTSYDDYQTYKEYINNEDKLTDDISNIARGFTLDKCFFVCDDFFANINQDFSGYNKAFIRLSGDRNKDIKFINTFKNDRTFIELHGKYENYFIILFNVFQVKNTYRNITNWVNDSNTKMWAIIISITVFGLIYEVLMLLIINRNTIKELLLLNNLGAERKMIKSLLIKKMLIIGLIELISSLIISVISCIVINHFINFTISNITIIGILICTILIIFALLLTSAIIMNRYHKKIKE